MPAGRPTIYNEEILTKVTEYIDSCKDIEEDKENKISRKVNIPTIEGLAVYLHINKDTIYTWRKEKKEFSELIEVLLDEQAKRLVNNGLAGTYNPTIAKVLLTKHGYTEKTETDITSKGEALNPVLVKFIDGKDN